MRSIADTLATVTPVLLAPGQRRPGNGQIREAQAVLSNVLDYGVGRGLDANPLAAAAKVWAPPTMRDACGSGR